MLKWGCSRAWSSARCYSSSCSRLCLHIETGEGLSIELPYTDDCVLIAETEEHPLDRLRKWKDGMDMKSLRVTAGEAEVMWCQDGEGKIKDSAKDP